MTDQEILAIAHRTATIYRHRSDPESPSYGFMNHTILDFARRIEQAAIAAERERCAVVAWTHYMDTCKKAGISPSTFPQFCCADAIRKGYE